MEIILRDFQRIKVSKLVLLFFRNKEEEIISDRDEIIKRKVMFNWMMLLSKTKKEKEERSAKGRKLIKVALYFLVLGF
jgi:hypothetical protein